MSQKGFATRARVNLSLSPQPIHPVRGSFLGLGGINFAAGKEEKCARLTELELRYDCDCEACCDPFVLPFIRPNCQTPLSSSRTHISAFPLLIFLGKNLRRSNNRQLWLTPYDTNEPTSHHHQSDDSDSMIQNFIFLSCCSGNG